MLLNNGYDNSNTRLLLEPTKQRILDNLQWFVNSSIAGDTIFMSYSEHGSQVNDMHCEEKDNQDERIFKSDLKTIADDELAQTPTKAKPGVRIVCLFDCCHSGSMLDLAHNWNHRHDNRFSFENNQTRYQEDIVCISGCMDNQVSLEINKSCLLTTAFVKN
jgi:hypothetical protein